MPGTLPSRHAAGTLQLSDLARGDVTCRHRLRNPSGKPLRCFAWSPLHATVATCGIERCASHGMAQHSIA